MDARFKEELLKSGTLAATRALAVKPKSDPASKADQDAQLAARDAMVAAYAAEAKKMQAALIESGQWIEGLRDLDWHDAFTADHGGSLRWEDFSVKALTERRS